MTVDWHSDILNKRRMMSQSSYFSRVQKEIANYKASE